MTESELLFSNRTTGISLRSPWNAMCCCETRIFSRSPRSAQAGGLNCCRPCNTSWQSSNNSQPNVAATSFLSPTARSGTRRPFCRQFPGTHSPFIVFGIDHAVNEAFLRQLACQQRGTSVLLNPNDDLVRPVAILGSRLSRPVLTDLTLDGGWELADRGLPDIHAGQVIFASMRAASNLSQINVAGRDAAGRPLHLALETEVVETDLPKLIWMKHRIDSLLRGGRDGEAVALAKKANLVCRGAAFVAWDDAEKVAIAQEEVYQPSLSHDSKRMVLLSRPSSSDSAVSLKCRVRDYHLKAVLEPCSDEELVGDISDLSKTERLTEQLTLTIDSVFYAPDAAELVGIMQDWATHTDEDQVCQTLCALLRECERDRDAGRLRRVLSDFFRALPDPWKTGRVPYLWHRHSILVENTQIAEQASRHPALPSAVRSGAPQMTCRSFFKKS